MNSLPISNYRSMMKMTPNSRLIRRIFSIALVSVAVVYLFPVYAFGQSGVTSATQSLARASNEPKSSPVEQGEANGLKVFALRLRPGQDLRQEIEKFAKERGLKAGFIITTVGSLARATLRLADQNETTSFAGKFEIVSLVGTLSQDGVHLHISLSDNTGRTVGGHLVEGCPIYTTAEIIIGEAKGIVFTRETDPATGYKELTIRPDRRPRKRGN